MLQKSIRTIAQICFYRYRIILIRVNISVTKVGKLLQNRWNALNGIKWDGREEGFEISMSQFNDVFERSQANRAGSCKGENTLLRCKLWPSWELDIKWTEKFKMPISGAFQIHMYLYIFSIDRCRKMQWPGNNGAPLARAKTVSETRTYQKFHFYNNTYFRDFRKQFRRILLKKL